MSAQPKYVERKARRTDEEERRMERGKRKEESTRVGKKGVGKSKGGGKWEELERGRKGDRKRKEEGEGRGGLFCCLKSKKKNL